MGVSEIYPILGIPFEPNWLNETNNAINCRNILYHCLCILHIEDRGIKTCVPLLIKLKKAKGLF